MDPKEGQTPPQGGNPPPLTIDKWREIIPEDIRGDASLKDIKDITGLAKSYVNAQKLVGSKLSIPKEDDEAAWNDLYGKLGRPESAEKYQVKRPELPEGFRYDENQEKQFLPIAHKLGLNNKQTNALIAWKAELDKQGHEQYKQGAQEAGEALKKEWGNNYDNKIAVAQRVVKDYADKAVVDFLESSKLGNNPAFIKFMYDIGSHLVEDGGAPRSGGDNGGANTKDEASKKIAALLADPAFAKKYFGQREQGHNEAVEEIFSLRKIVTEE